MRNVVLGSLLAAAVACSSGSGEDQLPAAAQQALDYLVAEMPDLDALIEGFGAVLPALLDPEARDEAGITFEEGAENVFGFEIPFDTTGDGTADTTATGTVDFNRQPVPGENPGLTGAVNGIVRLSDGGTIFVMATFEVTAEGLVVHGTIEVRDDADGFTTLITIPEDDPITAKAPTGDGEAVANFCTETLQGDASVEIEGPSVFFSAVLEFLFPSPTVKATDAQQGDSAETAEPLGDTTVNIGCDFSIEDWVGTFDMQWICPPGDGGTNVQTFVVTGPDTLEVTKVTPPGSGISSPTIFTATADPGNPHVLRGEFTETEAFGTYTETFVYRLSADGSSFTQETEFTYIDGDLEGTGGPCSGVATKR